MKRSLIRQMSRNGRDNVWLAVGLAIVSLVIWHLSYAMFCTLRYYFIPLGFDAEDVLVFDIDRVSTDSPEFIGPKEDMLTSYSDDLKGLMRRIRESRYVEAAAFTRCSLPYQQGFDSMELLLPVGDDTIKYLGHARLASPDIVEVLHLNSRTGKDREWLRQRLEEGELVVSNVHSQFKWSDAHAEGKDMKGKYVLKAENGDEGNDGFVKFHVADEIEMIRTHRYDYPFGGSIITPIDESGTLPFVYNIVVRVKPGCEGKFREEYSSTPTMKRQRNAGLYNLRTLNDMGRDIERGTILSVRLYAVFILFLLIIIFLGMLGTFWFRMEQRIGEIAIRRVCGASRLDIFRRMTGEGMVLLLCGSLLAAPLGWAAIISMNMGKELSRLQLLMLEVVTFAVMAFGIAVSIWGPAWMAMRVKPSEAVKED